MVNYVKISHLKKLETGIVILILLYSISVWWHPQVDTIEIQGSKPQTLMNLGIYLFTLISFLSNSQRVLYVITKGKLLLLLVGIALLSIVWTANPETTLQFSKGLVRTSLLGVYLATRYSLKEQIRLFAWTFGIAAILSLVFALAIPSQGLQLNPGPGYGSWRGVFFHKNHLGRSMLMSSSTFLLLALCNHKYRYITSTLFSLSVILIVLSNSKNALLGFLVILILFPLWIFLRQSFNLKMFLSHMTVFIASITSIVVLSNIEPILDSMGKDLSFTGRIPLWTILLEKFADKPWLGYGYYGFWSSEAGELTKAQMIAERSWEAGHAHNGFIETALSLGFLGLFLLVFSVLKAYLQAVNLSLKTETLEGLWPLHLLTIIIVVNLSMETTLLKPDGFWVLYVMISLTLALQQDRQKLIANLTS